MPILHALQEEFGYVDEAAVPLIADAVNMRMYWEPRMKKQLHEYVAKGGGGLHELVLEAEKQLK